MSQLDSAMWFVGIGLMLSVGIPFLMIKLDEYEKRKSTFKRAEQRAHEEKESKGEFLMLRVRLLLIRFRI